MILEAALALLEQFQTMVALQQMTAADQQTQAAEQAGMQNAALPQDGPKPEPSRPSVAHEAAALGA